MTKRAKATGVSKTMKTIDVRILQDKLNSLYYRTRGKHQTAGQPRHMEYLWDLKEMALIAGKSTVEVPKEWLTELEQCEASSRSAS
jgi:hypothetical protein